MIKYKTKWHIKKGAGSSRNGRESHSKRLGIKIFGGQEAIAGKHLSTSTRKLKHHPDKGVGIGKDHTLFALVAGTVVFRKKQDNKSYVSILPASVISEVVEKAVPTKKVEEAAAPVAEAPAKKAPAKKAAKADAAPAE